jgi:hypothetical protein
MPAPAPSLLKDPTWFSKHVPRTVKITRCYLFGREKPIAEMYSADTWRSHWSEVRRAYADWADCELDEIDWNDDRETVTLNGEDIGTYRVEFGGV